MVIDPSSANNPTLPTGWQDWAFWEFSPTGGNYPGQANIPLPFLRFNGSQSLLANYYSNLDAGIEVALGRRAILVEIGQGKLTGMEQEFIYTPGSPAALSPEKATLAVGLSGGRVQLINTSSGDVKGILPLGPAGSVTSLAYSPDGVYIAAGFDDASIWIWNFNQNSPSNDSLTDHSSPVLSLAFADSGEILASGSADGNIFLWNVEVMRNLAGPLGGRSAQVTALSFHPTGRYLFSGSAVGTVDYWLVNPQDWRELACLRAGRNLTQAEFKTYFLGQEYRISCPQYPPGK
jgi:hypothetical protein